MDNIESCGVGSGTISIGEPVVTGITAPTLKPIGTLVSGSVSIANSGYVNGSLNPYGWNWAVAVTPTLAEKAEIVLAMLLGRLTSDKAVVFEEMDENAAQDADASEVSDCGEYTLATINPGADFHEIIHALYQQLAIVRGRALK